MTVTSCVKNYDNLTMILIAEFDAPIQQVWELWANPRLLEKWWGPPSHPATVEQHDLEVGGSVTYYMTGPEGEKYHGWWHIDAVNPPSSLEFSDGFADEHGQPADQLPITRMQMQLSEHDGHTRMELVSVFPSAEQMKQVIEMGMEEGMQLAVGQIDALLAAYEQTSE